MARRILLYSYVCIFLFANALNPQAVLANTITIADLKPDIIEQIPSHLQVSSLTFESLENSGNSLVPVYRATVAITAKLKEPLYTIDGLSPDGKKTRIRKTQEPGISVNHTAAVVAIMPGALSQERKVTVLLKNDGALNNAFPLSSFEQGTYVIADSAVATVGNVATAANTPSPSNNETSTAAFIPNPETALIDRLIAVENAVGAVWGKAEREKRGIATADSPVLLKDIVRQGTEVSATIEYPYSRERRDITIAVNGDNHVGFHCTSRESNCNMNFRRDDNSRIYHSWLAFSTSIEENQKLKHHFAAKNTPWEQKHSPVALLQIGGTLWDANSGELLDDNWIAEAIRPVAEQPGLYWPADLMGLKAYIPGSLPSPHVQILTPPHIRRFNTLPDNNDGTLLVARDLSRYIALKNGDLWLAQINWQSNTVSTPQQITQLGTLTINDLKAWYGDDIYIWQKGNPEAPLTRIDAATGKVTTLGKIPAFNGRDGSPDGRYIYYSDGNEELIHVYDLKNREAFTVDAYRAPRNQGPISRDHTFAIKVEDKLWLDHSTFFSGEAWYDLSARQTTLITELPKIVEDLPKSAFVWSSQIIPGGNYLEATLIGQLVYPSGNPIPNSKTKKRYRINRVSGEVVELPLIPNEVRKPTAQWIDENRYVFYRTQGTPSETGTWLYNLDNATTTRISDLTPDHAIMARNATAGSQEKAGDFSPALIESPVLAMRAQNRVGFSTKKDNKTVYALISLTDEPPIFLDLPAVKRKYKYAQFFINDPFLLP